LTIRNPTKATAMAMMIGIIVMVAGVTG
jgi:hypothetical protein